jgi:hypothetical protein
MWREKIFERFCEFVERQIPAFVENATTLAVKAINSTNLG